MVQVKHKCRATPKNREYKLRIDGHADYAPEGQDIVCSAVSVLAQTLANALSDTGAYGLKVEMEPGHVYIRCTALMDDMEIYILFRFAMIGLEMLEEQYPDHVNIISD